MQCAMYHSNYELITELIPDIQENFFFKRLISGDNPEVYVRVLESRAEYKIVTMGQYSYDGSRINALNEFSFIINFKEKALALVAFTNKSYSYTVLRMAHSDTVTKDLEIYFGTWLRSLLIEKYRVLNL